MELSRKDFVKLSAPALALPLVAKLPSLGLGSGKEAGPAQAVPKAGEKAILYDGSKCNACRSCEVACRMAYKLAPQRKPQDLSPNSWTVVTTRQITVGGKTESAPLKVQCLHCTDAACVRVCSTGALQRNETSGAVEFDAAKCSGCGYCARFCPFHVPQVAGTETDGLQKASKCMLCSARLNAGMAPICVGACPFNALSFGERSQMVTNGSNRVAELRATYPNATLYGQNQLGGLHVLYVLKADPQAYGLPPEPSVSLGATVWKSLVHPMGWGLGGLAVVGLVVNFAVASQAKAKERAVAEKPAQEEAPDAK